MAEAFTLAEKSGVKPTQVHGLIKDILPAPMYVGSITCYARMLTITHRLDSYANKMVNDLFDGSKGFAIDGGIKDSHHIRKLAADSNSPMPALVRVPQVLVLLVSNHFFRTLRINIC